MHTALERTRTRTHHAHVQVGTIIQQVVGISINPDEKGFKFNKFRVNDIGAKDDVIELRREVPVPWFGTRATYNANIPMQKTKVFAVPPYVDAEF